MSLAPGTRLGVYETSARSEPAERLRPCRGSQRGSRAGMACRRHPRQSALGVGPQRQWKDVDPEPMPLITPCRLGRYEIQSPLGAGGMVYRATMPGWGATWRSKCCPGVLR